MSAVATSGQTAAGADGPGQPGRRGRLASARWAGAGLVDQAVLALANAGNTLLAAALLPRPARATC
jgi:hypothetical protein